MTTNLHQPASHARPRPLSPHLQVYRWTVTMALSICHRASGIFNTLAAYVFVLFLLSILCGEETYALFMDLASSLPGKLVFIGWAASVSFHMVNGIRHLFWDVGRGYSIAQATRSGIAVVVIAALIAAGFILLAGGYSMALYRSYLKQARGLGSAKEGAHHWLVQRFSGIVLVPLVLWLMVAISTQLIGADYATAVAWLKQPMNAILSILFVVFAMKHSALGVQVVIEDYVHCRCKHIALLIFTRTAAIVAVASGIFAVLAVYIKG